MSLGDPIIVNEAAWPRVALAVLLSLDMPVALKHAEIIKGMIRLYREWVNTRKEPLQEAWDKLYATFDFSKVYFQDGGVELQCAQLMCRGEHFMPQRALDFCRPKKDDAP